MPQNIKCNDPLGQSGTESSNESSTRLKTKCKKESHPNHGQLNRHLRQLSLQVKCLRSKHKLLDIEVDGGVGPNTIEEAAQVIILSLDKNCHHHHHHHHRRHRHCCRHHHRHHDHHNHLHHHCHHHHHHHHHYLKVNITTVRGSKKISF